MGYHTVIIDPPWRYNDRLARRGRGAANHYATLSQGDLESFPLESFDIAPDAHLYLWTTNAFMVEAHRLAEAWGFEQKTILTWCKTQFGMGHYLRNATEHALFCVRGRQPVLQHNVPSYFIAPRGRHSAKPEAFYDIVRSLSPGPYLEIFARQQRLGWHTWGNEAFKSLLAELEIGGVL